MTKLEILKSVDKAFTSDVLDSFYSVSIRSGNEVSLQGKYNPEIMKKVSNAFGLSMNEWSISDGGYVELKIDGSIENKIFMVNEEQLMLTITLTN
jgi:hypothetical protein